MKLGPPLDAPPSNALPAVKYFVDAWNASDGAMFASSRQARTDVWDDKDALGPDTFLLRAPDFDAVLVPRALAYGAVRRGSQEGLSLDGQREVEFDSLIQLRELARRAYIAGAIGDSGPQGDGQPQPGPAPPESGPEMLSLGPTQSRPDEHSTAELADALDAHSFAVDSDTRSSSVWRLRHALGNAVSEDTCDQAAYLLLQSADQALDCANPTHASMPLARSFVQLAATLTGWRRLETVLPNVLVGLQAQRLANFIFDPPWFSHRFAAAQHSQRFDPLQLLSEGLLPSHQVRSSLNLPPRCTVWIDALEYLSADRRYYQLSRHAQWLPLAVAVATIATSARVPLDAWSEWAEFGNGRHRRFWLDQIIDFIASMVPAAGLPPEVEFWLRDRCWLHQRDDRRVFKA
jgi:hypothetical protein